MNKRALILIFLLIFVGLAIFVSGDYDKADDYTKTITLEQGWNLVSLYVIPDLVELEGNLADWNKQQLEQKEIVVSYLYDKFNNKYIQTYPNPDSEGLKILSANIRNDASQNEYWAYTTSSMWIYTSKKQEITYSTVDGPAKLNLISLKTGWNFLAFTPQMIGKSLNNIRGNCKINRAYYWSSAAEKWFEFSLTELVSNEYLGYGLVVKVPEDCKLGTIEGGIPSIPEVPNINECTDSDGGTVIDSKGLTGDISTNNAYNDVCFIKESAAETSSTQECSGDNCYIKEYFCDSNNNPTWTEYLCKEKGFNYCKNGACVN